MLYKDVELYHAENNLPFKKGETIGIDKDYTLDERGVKIREYTLEYFTDYVKDYRDTFSQKQFATTERDTKVKRMKKVRVLGFGNVTLFLQHQINIIDEYLRQLEQTDNSNETQTNTPPTETELWRCVPVSKAKEHFSVFHKRNSKNGKPFLTETQYNNFIKRAFENDTNIEKQTFNLSSGEKGFIIKRFYEFFDLSITYGVKSDKQPYIDLVMDNFANWKKESEVKSFMKPNKSKRNW